MTDKAKPTEAEVQEWLDGVHFSSACNLPLTEEKHKSDKESPKKSHSEPVIKRKD